MDPNAITVEGQLFYQGSDVPMQDAVVILDGDLERSVVAGFDGRFRFRGVVPPYDLTVVDPIGWRQELVEFRALTRANPALSMYGAVDRSRSARVRGTIGGVDYPLAEGAEIRVALENVESEVFLSTRDGRREIEDFFWKGPASYSGSLVGVLIQEQADGGLDFVRAGAITPFEIVDGEDRSVELVLDRGIETDVTTLVVDSGAYSDQQLASLASFNVLGATLPGDVYGERPSLPEVVTIPADGARIAFVGFVGDSPWFRGGAAVVVDAVVGGETVLELPDELLLDTLAPEDGGELATSTPTLEWTPVPGALAYEVEVESSWDDEHSVYAKWILPPTVTSLEIPDYGDDLFRLLPGDVVEWTVYATTTGGRSPDELADPDGTGVPPLWALSRDYMVRGSFSIVP